MADFLQISIQGFPLVSFLAMLAAFWALGLLLTRETTQRASAPAARSQEAGLPVPQEAPAPSQPAATERKLAA